MFVVGCFWNVGHLGSSSLPPFTTNQTNTTMNVNPNERESQSQNRLLLRHLQMGGTITTLEALKLYGCIQLPSRICDLRKMGHAITSKFITLPNGKRVKEYRLAN